ncbi:MAG: TrkA C-terminal domain-containing protein [Spirulinaceae cyanobacterium]
MAALASLLVLITLSLLINRVATTALTLTGLSYGAAKFQARSALTGVGFTTHEAERIVNHPVRRRIILLLMLLGNAGIVTSISSLLLTFINTVGPREWIFRLLILGLGLFILWAIARSKWIDRYLSQIIRWSLNRWTRLDVRDYASLLHLSDEYSVTELEVQPGDWLANKCLQELNLKQEGITVLGIQRDNNRYVGAPKGDTQIQPGNTLLLYGRLSLLDQLDRRSADWGGEQAHHQAVADQQRILSQQDREEAQHDR